MDLLTGIGWQTNRSQGNLLLFEDARRTSVLQPQQSFER